jgi:hypothetical protein
MRPSIWLVLLLVAVIGTLSCGYAFFANALALGGHFSAERQAQLETSADRWLIAFIGFSVATVATLTGYVVSLSRRLGRRVK